MARADKEQKKTRARIRTAEATKARETLESGGQIGGAAARVIEPKAKYDRRQSGLVALHNRNKLTYDQRLAGERYGRIFRNAEIEGQAMIKSALGSLDEARGSGTGGRLPDLLPAELLAGDRKLLHLARVEGLRDHPGMVAVCDVICGKEWTSQMVTPDRSSQLQIETTLRNALDLLIAYFAAKGGQTAAESVAA